MLIRLNNIKKYYDEKRVKVTALDGIDLEIEKGEFVAITGASGSGKSTLLNILGCLDKMSSGEYYLEEKAINNYSDDNLARVRNEKIGFVVQDFALIEKYSVSKNVLLPLMYSKIKRKDRDAKVKDIVSRVGLEEKIDTLVTRLSGGQRQRVAIARALVNDADILLCDEPTGALDKNTGKEIMDIFEEWNKQGKTVIIVTHDEKIAHRCKRIIEIEDGKVISDVSC